MAANSVIPVSASTTLNQKLPWNTNKLHLGEVFLRSHTMSAILTELSSFYILFHNKYVDYKKLKFL